MSFSGSKIDFIVREAENNVDWYDMFNGKAKHVKD